VIYSGLFIVYLGLTLVQTLSIFLPAFNWMITANQILFENETSGKFVAAAKPILGKCWSTFSELFDRDDAEKL
jgi:hypothetical protein